MKEEIKNLIKDYLSLPFEKKTIISTIFSVIFNFIMGIGKIVIGIFSTMFLVASGFVNIFIMLSKIQVFLGIKYPNKKSFNFRNTATGIFLILASLQYIIFMLRPILFDIETKQYDAFMGIAIAFVSFIELGISIFGCFKAFGKGHYYRNIKLINLCSAFTAIVLTENALLSFSSQYDSSIISSYFGIGVGVVNILIGIYILLAPRISIVDRKYSIYKLKDECENELVEKRIYLQLTNSKFYGNYFYEGNINNEFIKGEIKKGKSPIKEWNIYIKIIIIIFSEILIFPYAIGALIFHFKSSKVIKKLDDEMLKYNYLKINEMEDLK